jgi:uncharacterized protein YuzE
MDKKKTRINYDIEEDILVLSKCKKVKESIDVGDFIIDVDKENFISGIEILNASQNLNISGNDLKEIKNASMNVAYKTKNVIITLVLQYNGKEKDVSIPLSINLGHIERIEKTEFALV